MIWAEISATAKTDLVFIDENLNGQRYINEVQTPHVLPFLRQMPVHVPTVQVDNARPHRARIVTDFIHRNNVNRIARPVVLPDLSRALSMVRPWESCVGASQSEKHTASPSTLSDERIGRQQTIRRHEYSSKNMVRECRRNNGGYTQY